MAVLDQEFPLVCRVLELIEVERNQVIEEVALDLAAEYV